MLSKMTAKISRPDIQVLINEICSIFMDKRNVYWFEFIPGKENIYADNLSRYFDQPLAGKTHIFKNKLDVLPELKRASALASKNDFIIQQKHLKFIDDDN